MMTFFSNFSKPAPPAYEALERKFREKIDPCNTSILLHFPNFNRKCTIYLYQIIFQG